jgi:signal transduction histidine kinase
MPGTDEPAAVTEAPESSTSGSRRLALARERAQDRLKRQRDIFRPLGWAVIAIVTISNIGAHPAPGMRGTGLGITIALSIFVITFVLAISDRFTEGSEVVQAVDIAVMGAAGVALAALQPQGATGLAGSAAVWVAVVRLPFPWGVALGAALTVALAIAIAAAGGSASAVLAATLACAFLALAALFMKRARESQNQTELLLAQLEDAREEQTRAAAIAERSRIASELHDVLAHSLSGAAIQLQSARVLAEREHAGPQMRMAIDRASELVKDGLTNAKQAVGALRGDELPGVEQLPTLIDRVRGDLHVPLTLLIEGDARQLPAEASLALYRGAQEALTNVARYAHGASSVVVLRYDDDHTSLSVENGCPAGAAPLRGEEALGHVGGGRGLAGLRERLQRVGGSMSAGPKDGGWRVDMEVPA